MPPGLGRVACSPDEAQQPQCSPQLAVKPSQATEAPQPATPASAQHVAAEAAWQRLACRAASCNTGCHSGNPQPGQAELPVPAKVADTCEAAQAEVPAAREPTLSAARDTSRAAHEGTGEQALSAARDASQAAQLQVPGGALTAEEQLNLAVARFNAAMSQRLSVARPAFDTSKARAQSHAASDEAPAAVGQALRRPAEDGAASRASAELAGSHPKQATLPRTSSSPVTSGSQSGSQASQATLPGAGRDGTARHHRGAQLRSGWASDAIVRAADPRRRLLDLPRRVYNVKGQQVNEQVRHSTAGASPKLAESQ